MLRQVADGVLIHQSDFMLSNAVVVRGDAGVLVIDPGIRGDELACLAIDLRELGQRIVAGFSTHPHWDHLLRDPSAGAKARVAERLPPDIADQIPLEQLGQISGLPLDADEIPWDGPRVRIVEHQAHAPGHAALLIEQRGVLVAGDMLSDVLIPMLDSSGAADPIDDYLAALRRLEDVAGDVDVVIPGHGSIGGPGQVGSRIEQDRAYVHALREAGVVSDPRIGPSAREGWEWVAGVHERRREGLARTNERDGTPA